MISAVVAIVQTVIIASFFGATRTVEIFFAATTFQELLLNLSNNGQVGDLFTPIFHRIQAEHGRDAARRAFAAITNVMLLIATVIAGLAALFSAAISRMLVPGFSDADILLCSQVFMVTAPIIVIQIANSMYSDLLTAEHQYGVAETLGVLSRVVNVIILVLLSWMGVWALILGMWVSALAQLFGRVAFARRTGVRHEFILSTREFHPRLVLFKIPFTLTHILASQFFAFAVTAGLSYLPEGSYAAYGYAKRLHAKFQGIILRPIGVVFFNHFSQAISEGAQRVRSYAQHALALSVAVVTLVSVPIAVTGDLVLMALWGGEKFSAERIIECYLILMIFTVMLVINAQYLVSRRTNLAIKVVGPQFVMTGIVLLLSGIAALWLIPHFGIWGALLIQTVAMLGTALVTILVLAMYRADLVAVLPIGTLVRWCGAATVAIIVVLLVRRLGGITLDSPRWLLLVSSAAYGLVATVICAGVSLALGIAESREILVLFRKLFKKIALNHG